MSQNLQDKIKEVKQSIVAIGFNPSATQITILGSGFIADGKIITAAHLLNNLNEEQIKNLKANIMVEQLEKDLERYKWMPIKLYNDKRDIKNDLAIFEFSEEKPQKIKDLVLGDSEDVEIGKDVYFIGFPYAAQLMNDGFGVTLIVNKGIVSNIKRDGVDQNHPRNWFIIDAISNPGNSGCPVLDAETNEVVGIMTISFRIASKAITDIREPMHIAGAKPINLVKNLLNN